jgi:hypothetical protein
MNVFSGGQESGSCRGKICVMSNDVPQHILIKLQHWRGFQGKTSPEGAPVLEFSVEFLASIRA